MSSSAISSFPPRERCPPQRAAFAMWPPHASRCLGLGLSGWWAGLPPPARRLSAQAQVPRDHRRDSEEKRPDGGHGTLLPQALRNVALPGSGVPPPASKCWHNTSGLWSCSYNRTGVWGGYGCVNRAVSGNCHFLTPPDHLRWANLIGQGRPYPSERSPLRPCPG